MTAAAGAVDVSVCIPTYNEKGALRKTVVELIDALTPLPYSYEIIVIDDGSTDGSVKDICDLPVRIIRHRRNLGGGVARLTGLRYARGRWVVQTDADGTYPVDRVPAMLERLRSGADMVIGARRRESATDWQLLRVAMKWLLKSFASWLTGREIPDLNSGMRVYDRTVALHFAYLYPPGHSIMSTMTLAMMTNGMWVEFEEIDYHVRMGRSTFRPIRDTYNYFVTIVRAMTYFDPLRVFIPPALFFLVAGIVAMIRNFVVTASLGFLPPVLLLGSMLLMTVGIISDQFARLARGIDWNSRVALTDRLIEEVVRDAPPEVIRGVVPADRASE
jgi:glycosyltransferase involved in cell wall biosynthesis